MCLLRSLPGRLGIAGSHQFPDVFHRAVRHRIRLAHRRGERLGDRFLGLVRQRRGRGPHRLGRIFQCGPDRILRFRHIRFGNRRVGVAFYAGRRRGIPGGVGGTLRLGFRITQRLGGIGKGGGILCQRR